MPVRNLLPSTLLLFFAFFLPSCSGGTDPIDDGTPEDTSVVQRGAREFAIDLNEAEGESYDQTVALARSIGATGASLSIGWEDIETAPGVYNPAIDLLAIAESYYPAVNLSILLMIGPIDTNVERMPSDLKGKTFDDPEVIARFTDLIDYVFTKIPTLDLSAISIGNEVDIYLGNDTAAWWEYHRFVDTVARYIHSKRPDLSVGVKMTLEGLVGDSFGLAELVNRSSDVILATYYPIDFRYQISPSIDPAFDVNWVSNDFGMLGFEYPIRPIRIAEIGFPSGSANGSSEDMQVEFIRDMFRAWDRHADRITAISFSIMTDRSQSEVEEFGRYYGVDDPAFLSFLRTLGLRKYDGTRKKGWEVLVEELEKRGW